jgi:electron transfer flavoprotein alpha subunit
MAVLILAKHDNASLNDATAKTVTAAKAMGSDLHLLVAGENCAAVAEAGAALDGVSKVIHVEAPAYAHRLAEPLTDLIAGMAEGYSHIVFPATTTGKNVAPRLAAKLDVMVISEVIAVQGPDTFDRPIYAGNAIQTVQSADPVKILTVRGASFEATGAQAPARSRPRTPPPIRACRAGSRTRSQPRTGRSLPAHGSSSRAAAASARKRTSASSRSSPTRSARRSAPRAPRSTAATPRTTGRSARPARSWPPISTSPSASRARSSTSPA